LTVFLTAGAVYVYTSNPQPAVASAKPSKSGKPRSGSVLLEAMKEELFQLESDRLEGKITPQEYELSKAALDKTLQRAVKRQATAKYFILRTSIVFRYTALGQWRWSMAEGAQKTAWA